MLKLEGLTHYMEVSDILINIIKTKYLHTTINSYYQYDDVDSLLGVGILNKVLYTDSENKTCHMMRGVDINKIDEDFEWKINEKVDDNILILFNLNLDPNIILKLIPIYKYIIVISKSNIPHQLINNKLIENNISLDHVYFLTHDCISKAMIYLLETYFNYFFDPLHYKIVDEISKLNNPASRKEGQCFLYAFQKDTCIGTHSNKWVLNSTALFDNIDTLRFNHLRFEGSIIYSYLKSKHYLFCRNKYAVNISGVKVAMFNHTDFNIFFNPEDYNADVLIIYYKNGRNGDNCTTGILKCIDENLYKVILEHNDRGLFRFDGNQIIIKSTKIGQVISSLYFIFTNYFKSDGQHQLQQG